MNDAMYRRSYPLTFSFLQYPWDEECHHQEELSDPSDLEKVGCILAKIDP